MPLLPTTIRSTFSASATSRILSAGSPSTLRVVAAMPRSAAVDVSTCSPLAGSPTFSSTTSAPTFWASPAPTLAAFDAVPEPSVQIRIFLYMAASLVGRVDDQHVARRVVADRVRDASDHEAARA